MSGNDRTPVQGETELDRLDALIEAYEPGNYALADGVCHVYYDVPGSTTTLYADLVKIRRAVKSGEGIVTAAREIVQAKDADSPYIEQHMSTRLRSAITRMAECLKRSGEAWRSIETAPHNTPVLLYCPELGITNPERIELGCASQGTSTANGSSYSCHAWATRWMPLPAFPTPPHSPGDQG